MRNNLTSVLNFIPGVELSWPGSSFMKSAKRALRRARRFAENPMASPEFLKFLEGQHEKLEPWFNLVAQNNERIKELKPEVRKNAKIVRKITNKYKRQFNRFAKQFIRDTKKLLADLAVKAEETYKSDRSKAMRDGYVSIAQSFVKTPQRLFERIMGEDLTSITIPQSIQNLRSTLVKLKTDKNYLVSKLNAARQNEQALSHEACDHFKRGRMDHEDVSAHAVSLDKFRVAKIEMEGLQATNDDIKENIVPAIGRDFQSEMIVNPVLDSIAQDNRDVVVYIEDYIARMDERRQREENKSTAPSSRPLKGLLPQVA